MVVDEIPPRLVKAVSGTRMRSDAIARNIRARWRSVLRGALFLGLLLSAPLSVSANEYTAPVPLNDQSKGTKAALKKMATSLARVRPDKMRELRSFETKEGVYVLYGDLFRTGHLFALSALSRGGMPNVEPDTEQSDSSVDNSAPPVGLGFAEWTGAAWEPRGLWRIEPIWRPKGWKLGGDDYLPETPATKPFWMKLLGGDGHPKVIVAGDVEKYFQDFQLLQFDPKTHTLAFIASAMAEPEFIDGWVRLYEKSPRRAIWEQWTYHRWEGDKLVPKAAWHEEVPYDSSEKSFVKATRFDSKGGKQEFMFYDESMDDCTITRDGHPFAQVKIEPRRPAANAAPETFSSNSESAYLFEKLTGVPRKLQVLPEGTSASARLEKLATIRVTGSKEAVRMLSPGR